MTVIKRDRQSSAQDLVKAIEQLNILLAEQGENDAVADLKIASEKLKQSQAGTPTFKEAVTMVIDAFEGDHELMAYTHQRAEGAKEWTEAEELSIVSSRVLSLARRVSY